MSEAGELCIHEMMPQYCSICLAPKRNQERTIEDSYSNFVTKGQGVVRAKYDGKCGAEGNCIQVGINRKEPECGYIQTGEWIIQRGDKWYHEECDESSI